MSDKSPIQDGIPGNLAGGPKDSFPNIGLLARDGRWLEACPKLYADAERAAQAVFNRLQHVEPVGDISIVFAGDEFIHELNRQYRGKDSPTNVLSFPYHLHAMPKEAAPGLLGDIALAYETVLGEARAQAKSVSDHMMHLLVHGILHLLGYDHADDGQAEEMERLETDILRSLGIDDPYRRLDAPEHSAEAGNSGGEKAHV